MKRHESKPRVLCVFTGGLFCEWQAPGYTLMAVTIEDLYRSYGILADAKDNLSQVGERKASCSNTLAQRVVLFNFFPAVIHFTVTCVD